MFALAAGVVALGPAVLVGLIALASESGAGAIVAVGVFTVVYFEIVFGGRPE